MDSLKTSKLRYGLQLWATVRVEDTDSKRTLETDLQKVQNKLVIIMERKRISNKIPVNTMLENQGMLSVNQTVPQIKLVEMWKAKNDEKYLVRIEFKTADENKVGPRGATSGRVVKTGRTSKAKTTFMGEGTRLWNRAPTSKTQAEVPTGQREK